jgi:uncharacterized protein (DUF58 family)
MGYFFQSLFVIAKLYMLVFVLMLMLDLMLVYGKREAIKARRITGDKLSNGDDNKILVVVENHYPYPITLQVIDELPEQLQQRNASYTLTVPAGQEKVIQYYVRPVKRGEYYFGTLNIYVSSTILLCRKRMKFAQDKMVPCYPSFLQMRKYELMAISNRLVEFGIKKIRRVGNTMEFDQIRDYIPGDDVRHINWKATARKAALMVNQFQDERSQQVYSIIDKGRVMKMPFGGMTLLDYAINAALVISNVALLKHDKPGLITFSEKKGAFIPAERKAGQMHRIMEVLYRQKTRFLESEYEKLYMFTRQRITTRSLLLFYTNFESLSSMRRQLPVFKMMARNHLLVVIFFENTELKELVSSEADSLEGIYIKTIAEKFAYDKRQIVLELAKYGIHSILTPPEGLTVNTINKYLELKARGLI